MALICVCITTFDFSYSLSLNSISFFVNTKLSSNFLYRLNRKKAVLYKRPAFIELKKFQMSVQSNALFPRCLFALSETPLPTTKPIAPLQTFCPTSVGTISISMLQNPGLIKILILHGLICHTLCWKPEKNTLRLENGVCLCRRSFCLGL